LLSWMDPCSNWGYSNYTTHGLGCDRTSSGSGYAAQYPPALTKILDDLTTCGKTSPPFPPFSHLFSLFSPFFHLFFSFFTFFLSRKDKRSFIGNDDDNSVCQDRLGTNTKDGFKQRGTSRAFCT
jgi:hypothetical protein